MGNMSFLFGPPELPVVGAILSVGHLAVVGYIVYRLFSHSVSRQRRARRTARRMAQLAHDETIRRFGSDGRRRLDHNTMSARRVAARTAMTRIERCRLGGRS